MRTLIRSFVLAGALAAGLVFADGVHAASTKGRIFFSNLHPGAGQPDTYEVSSSEMEFGEPGECKLTVQARLLKEGPVLVHHQDDIVPQVKLELLGAGQNPNAWYYRATLTDVHVKKVTSRSIWGSDFEEIELEPTQVVWLYRAPKPDGTLDQETEVVVDCTVHR